MGKLFGTNGVRGIFSEDFNLEFIHDLTLSISTYFQHGTILVGYDGRHSSPVISKVVCSTLNFAGIDCHIAGLVPTPCLEFATKNLGYDGGIMITASHNPSEYNGIKPVASDGVEISREDEEVIEGIFFKKNWKFDSSVYGTTKNDSAAVQTYIDGIKSQVDVSKIKSGKFKVVLDIGNGAQAVTAVKLCEQLGCEVITINEQIDGNFPGRGSEPLPSNLHELSSAVVKNDADFGIAFDGDGDRLIMVDHTGEKVDGDELVFIIAKAWKKNGTLKSSIVVGTKMSNLGMREALSGLNINFIESDVGDRYVMEQLLLNKAILGGEGSGHIICLNKSTSGDGIIAALQVLEVMFKSNQSLYDLKNEMKKYPQVLINVQTNGKLDLENHENLNQVLSIIKGELADKGRVLIRESGTEPLVRVMVESVDLDLANKSANQLAEALQSI